MSEKVSIRGHDLELLPEKAVWWAGRKMLLLADLHLGKVNHFRRSGVPLPEQPNAENLERFIRLVQTRQPERVVFLGDLFHSHYNDEWEAFGRILNHFPGISFELVMGNHDIMSRHQYTKHRLLVHDHSLVIDGFTLTHEPEETEDTYNLAGHIHPGVRMTGRGRQRLRFPCFFFGRNQGILPAFGAFTGVHPLRPKKGDQVFIIAESRVMRIAASL